MPKKRFLKFKNGSRIAIPPGVTIYTVEIRHYTHTKFQPPKMQEKHRVEIAAAAHRPKLAAIGAGCPKSAQTKVTGYYSNEIPFRDLPADKTVRNWTEWHVITRY